MHLGGGGVITARSRRAKSSSVRVEGRGAHPWLLEIAQRVVHVASVRGDGQGDDSIELVPVKVGTGELPGVSVAEQVAAHGLHLLAGDEALVDEVALLQHAPGWADGVGRQSKRSEEDTRGSGRHCTNYPNSVEGSSERVSRAVTKDRRESKCIQRTSEFVQRLAVREPSVDCLDLDRLALYVVQHVNVHLSHDRVGEMCPHV